LRRILHVMDLFGTPNALSKGVAFIEQYALEHGFDVIDFYSTHGGVNAALISHEWFSVLDDTCFEFPHLFQPLEMRHPPTTSLIYWAREGMAQMADLSRLYVTKQDADLDRPTGHSLEKRGA